MSNKRNSVLYTGVTSNLIKRVWEHRNKTVVGFTAKYNVSKLLYYEVFEDITQAIRREKQIKGGSRKDKIDLVNKLNPHFRDSFDEIASS